MNEQNVSINSGINDHDRRAVAEGLSRLPVADQETVVGTAREIFPRLDAANDEPSHVLTMRIVRITLIFNPDYRVELDLRGKRAGPM